MSEATFPIVGTAFVLVLVLPAAALVAKVLLMLLERRAAGGPLHGLAGRYMVLIGSSALPLLWLVSAGVHQIESGRRALACVIRHEHAALCLEPGYFALLLASIIAAVTLRSLRRVAGLRRASPDVTLALRQRLDQLTAREPTIAPLRARFVLLSTSDVTLGTAGLLRRRVYVALDYASRLTDEMLTSALTHERVHVESYDSLRYLLLEIALAVNPIGRLLLQADAARWVAAREAHCDREAVRLGASPLHLAEAIVRAARPSRVPVGLGSADLDLLRLRVELLASYADEPPAACCRSGRAAVPLGAFLLVLAALLPHRTSTRALDALHAGAEHAVTLLRH